MLLPTKIETTILGSTWKYTLIAPCKSASVYKLKYLVGKGEKLHVNSPFLRIWGSLLVGQGR